MQAAASDSFQLQKINRTKTIRYAGTRASKASTVQLACRKSWNSFPATIEHLMKGTYKKCTVTGSGCCWAAASQGKKTFLLTHGKHGLLGQMVHNECIVPAGATTSSVERLERRTVTGHTAGCRSIPRLQGSRA